MLPRVGLLGLLPVGGVIPAAVDPSLATIVVSGFATFGGIVIAIIQGRNSAERLADKSRIKLLERALEDLGGDPDDV